MEGGGNRRQRNLCHLALNQVKDMTRNLMQQVRSSQPVTHHFQVISHQKMEALLYPLHALHTSLQVESDQQDQKVRLWIWICAYGCHQCIQMHVSSQTLAQIQTPFSASPLQLWANKMYCGPKCFVIASQTSNTTIETVHWWIPNVFAVIHIDHVSFR